MNLQTGVSADLAPILPVLSLPVLPALTLPVPVSSSTTSTTWWQQFPHVVISGSTGTTALGFIIFGFLIYSVVILWIDGEHFFRRVRQFTIRKFHDMQRNVLRRINTSRLDDFTNTLTSAWDNFTNNFSIGRDDTDVFNGNRIRGQVKRVKGRRKNFVRHQLPPLEFPADQNRNEPPPLEFRPDNNPPRKRIRFRSGGDVAQLDWRAEPEFVTMDPIYPEYDDYNYNYNIEERDSIPRITTAEYDENGGDTNPPYRQQNVYTTDPEPEPNYEGRPAGGQQTFSPSVGVYNSSPENRITQPATASQSTYGGNGVSVSYHPELNYDPIPPDHATNHHYTVPNIYSESLKEAYQRNQLYDTRPDQWPREWAAGGAQNDRRRAKNDVRREQQNSQRQQYTPSTRRKDQSSTTRWYDGDYSDQFLDTHDYYNFESEHVDPEKHFTKYE